MKKKNILYLTRRMGIGGTEKIVLQLCNEIGCEFNKVIVCSNGGIHEKELKEMGIRHYCIPDLESKNIISIVKTIFTIIKILNVEKIDIIHTHHRMAAFYGAIFKKFIRIDVVNTAHNTFYNKKRLTKFALKDVKTIAVGERVKENIVEYFNVDEKNVSVIYNGVGFDTNNREINELKELKSKGYFLVGNIGRLSEQKGMIYFIDACYKINKIEPKIKFFIIGDGELKENLINKVKSIGMEENIIFLGYRDDISNIISNIDLIVLSSLWEGLPLTPIEAFMNKKTIVATDVDGTAEVVKHNFNGILVNKKNSEEIKDAVIELFNDNNKRIQFEKNAFNTYISKFSIQKFREEYIKFYKSL
ncbi:MAG: glycosyltransferase family 4 protein [Clostridium celatum]|nr:glycosyltransferase family 4 protein [Clostridium celatum]